MTANSSGPDDGNDNGSSAGGPSPNGGSGSDTAMQAMIRKRRQSVAQDHDDAGSMHERSGHTESSDGS
jgi:hypothetical protein